MNNPFFIHLVKSGFFKKIFVLLGVMFSLVIFSEIAVPVLWNMGCRWIYIIDIHSITYKVSPLVSFFVFFLLFAINFLNYITSSDGYNKKGEFNYDWAKDHTTGVSAEERGIEFYGEEEKQVINETGGAIYKKGKEEASENILFLFRRDPDKKTLADSCSFIFKNTVERIGFEIKSLTRRGNVNLVVGGLTGLAGLAVLLYFIFSDNYTGNEGVGFIYHFAPRLSFVIFFEAFAYFFLKLYRASLEEIKFYQNELTNIEQKFVAAVFAMDLEEPAVTKEFVINMLRTERNFILKKDQTTVGLEKEKIGDKNILSALENISKIFKK